MQPVRRVGLLPWGDLIEDFLDTIGVSFEAFCNEMTGGWMFGYVESLKKVGIQTVLFCFSARVTCVERHLHKPTGALICVLPSPKVYQTIRKRMLNPYGWNIQEVYGNTGVLRHHLFGLVRDMAPYIATPVRLLAHQLKKEGCQAIVCQEYEYARFDMCILIGKLIHIQVFATFQGGIFQFSRLERFLRPITLRICTGLIVAAKTEKQRLQAKYRIDPLKIKTIFNPIDIHIWNAIDKVEARKLLSIPLHTQVVVCHGRISIKQKGLDILLDAWVELCKASPDKAFLLIMVGTGKDSNEFQRQIEEKAVKNILWINQYIHDKKTIITYLSAADLYTLPSRHEGFPVAPIEAMACGLPVIVADAPGITDILENGEISGGVIIPREDVKALASAIDQVLDNKEWRKELGKNARRRVENHFSLEVVGSQLEECFLQRIQ